MKTHFFLILLFIISSNSIGQTMDHVVFDYDNAGNQINRHLIDVVPGRQSNPNAKDVKNLTDADLIKADIYDDIKYYPNPVKVELYIEWQVTDRIKVTSIELYDLSGKLLKTVNKLENTTNYIFPFNDFPQAIYSLNLVYINGEQKSLKIIKH